VGRIHIAAANPIHFNGAKDVSVLGIEIQQRQKDLVHVSDYHIQAASKVLGISPDTIRRALAETGCHFWPGNQDCCSLCKPETPLSALEQWMALLHFGHKFSPFLKISHPKWSKWLNKSGGDEFLECQADSTVQQVVGSLAKCFDEADAHVDMALAKLYAKGISNPGEKQILEIILCEPVSCPVILLRAAIDFRVGADAIVSMD